MNDLRYEKDANGMYILRDASGSALVATEQPAVIIDRDSGLMHKHGDYLRMLKIAYDMKAKYLRVGAPEMAEDLLVLSLQNIDLEELNRCISVDRYCKKLLDRITSN